MVAVEIIDPPGPRHATTPTTRWSSTCVYTMRHASDLEACLAEGGNGEWTENKRWVSGLENFEQAEREGLPVPIVFSAADVDSGLIFFGRLTSIVLEEGAANANAPLAPRTPGAGGDWRALPRAALLAWLLARPTVADAAWTRVPREPGEDRADFVRRVLGPARDTGHGTTRYSFTDLRRIEPPRPLSALRLSSTGNPLSDNYIRPYAICRTPDFLPTPA